jgi:hypothetical protein
MHVDATVLLVGKRRTGKTTWAKQILHSLRGRIGRFCLIAGNKDVPHEWDCITKLYVTPKQYALVKLRDLKLYQEARVSEFTRRREPIPYKYRVCIVLDDCGSDEGLMKSEIIRDIFANGRHYGMFTLVLVQYYYQIPRRCRENVDYLGVLRISNSDILRKIYKELIGFSDFRLFRYITQASTDSYGMCFINNTVINSVAITDQVFFKHTNPTIRAQSLEHGQVARYGQAHDITPARADLSPGLDNVESLKLRSRYEFQDSKGSVLILKKFLHQTPEID